MSTKLLVVSIELEDRTKCDGCKWERYPDHMCALFRRDLERGTMHFSGSEYRLRCAECLEAEHKAITKEY